MAKQRMLWSTSEMLLWRRIYFSILRLKMKVGCIIMTLKKKKAKHEYWHYDLPTSKKLRTQPSAKNLIFTVFCYVKHVYVTKYLQTGMTEFYVAYRDVKTLAKMCVCHIWKSTRPVFLQYDNAWSHIMGYNWGSSELEIQICFTPSIPY